MSTSENQLGTWFNLGTKPLILNWVRYNIDVVGAVTFRLAYFADWAAWEKASGYRSFIYVRFVYPDTPELDVSLATRLFPKPEQVIAVFPYLPDVDRRTIPRQIEVRQIKQFRPVPSKAELLPLSLKIEYLEPLYQEYQTPEIQFIQQIIVDSNGNALTSSDGLLLQL